MDRIMLFGFLEELKSFDEEAVSEVIDEVKAEMFEPESGVGSENLEVPHDGRYHPSRPLMTPAGNEVQDTQYYLDMLVELVDALDDAIGHKVKLTQYIDKLMKKKFKTYVRLKADDKKESQ